ncbi:MAG: hydantoinase B/oxoprolinase family protein [Deltaproteobacteria bacterium]|nr:hydantoinase B/oxoprolinase family protein [Deltaproteobacteria bacterium]
MKRRVDPITMQVIRYAMEQIADEMGYTLVRTSRSTIIKEIMDITCAVFDEQGQTIAQAHHAPMLLTGFEITMKELVRRFRPETLHDGDIIVCNDPYMGGQHIMDLMTISPVRFKGRLIGFVANLAHQQDMGGSAPGGVAGGMTEIYQEGLRLPMVKLYKKGVEDQEIMAIIANQIRVPHVTIPDIRAQVSCNFVGIRRLKEVFAKYGPEVVRGCTRMLLDYSESRIREGLKRLPDGDFMGEDWIDNDGVTDKPVHIQVNIHKRGDKAVVDFEGTDAQVRGNINCPIATAYAAVYYTMIAVVDPHVPPNSGCYRPVKIEAREGLIVNPRLPAPVAARTNCSQKIVEAMMKAFAGIAPDRVMAGSHGQITTCAFSGYHPRTGKRFVYTDIQGGGAGGRWCKDGRDGQDSHLARFMNTPIEAAELEYPVRIERYEFMTDSGGAGRFRGGLALRRDVRVLHENMMLARYSDRQEFPPFGILGGKDGQKGRLVLNPGTPQERRLKAKGLEGLQQGDVVSMQVPGAGGYGDPLERDLAQIEADVRDGKVSVEAARRDYQVVIDPAGLRVDLDATKRLRQGA